MPSNNLEHHYHSTKRATIVSAITNTCLGVTKVGIGAVGHSQALIADGIHSFSDLLSDALVLLAAKAGSKTADKEHPYGHRRIETFTVIIIALLLVSVGLMIGYHTSMAVFTGKRLPAPSFNTLIVAVLSIFANEGLYQYMIRIANHIESDLLRSNAWHNRTDALSSIVVMISLSGEMLGVPYLDAIGAIIIGIFIIRIGARMGWQSVRELIDTAVDEATLNQIRRCILKVPGVLSIHELRTRLLGGSVFVDVHILVDSKISVSEGHFISEQVAVNLRHKIERVVDVIVHIDPEDDEYTLPSAKLPPRHEVLTLLKQRWQTLPYFDQIDRIDLHYLAGKLSIEIHLPKQVSENSTLLSIPANTTTPSFVRDGSNIANSDQHSLSHAVSSTATLLEQYQMAAADLPMIQQIIILHKI